MSSQYNVLLILFLQQIKKLCYKITKLDVVKKNIKKNPTKKNLWVNLQWKNIKKNLKFKDFLNLNEKIKYIEPEQAFELILSH